MPCGRLGFVLYETDSSSVDIVILLDSTTRPSNMVDQKHVLLAPPVFYFDVTYIYISVL